MARIWLADSSIWIPYLRSGTYRDFLFMNLAQQSLFLPGPVLGELYAGATTREDRRDLETLRKAVGRHCVAPAIEDWVQAGRALAAYCSRFGHLKPSDHLVDVLLVAIAIALGARLATENLRDMTRWKKTFGRRGRGLRIETPRP